MGPSCLVNTDNEVQDSELHPTVFRKDYATCMILICV